MDHSGVPNPGFPCFIACSHCPLTLTTISGLLNTQVGVDTRPTVSRAEKTELEKPLRITFVLELVAADEFRGTSRAPSQQCGSTSRPFSRRRGSFCDAGNYSDTTANYTRN
jgi:hypothetical protein